jgi:hypothetical protein
VLNCQPQLILILQEVKPARNTRTVVVFKPMLEASDSALHFALWGQTQRLANGAGGSGRACFGFQGQWGQAEKWLFIPN